MSVTTDLILELQMAAENEKSLESLMVACIYWTLLSWPTELT